MISASRTEATRWAMISLVVPGISSTKPKILILDDSTSAVDTATDAAIRKAFAEEIPGTTKLIIAQRIASVQDADMIIILENGMIADVGTHADLYERCHDYRVMVDLQKLDEKQEGEEEATHA